MCSVQENDASTKTPRTFSHWLSLIWKPLIDKVSVLNQYTWSLFLIHLKPFYFRNTSAISSNTVLSVLLIQSLFFPFADIVLSSAKRSVLWFGLYKGKSLIKIKNNTGPITDPWGKPNFTCCKSENVFEIETIFCRSN